MFRLVHRSHAPGAQNAENAVARMVDQLRRQALIRRGEWVAPERFGAAEFAGGLAGGFDERDEGVGGEHFEFLAASGTVGDVLIERLLLVGSEPAEAVGLEDVGAGVGGL